MKTGKMERFMKDLEILGLLVACVSSKFSSLFFCCLLSFQPISPHSNHKIGCFTTLHTHMLIGKLSKSSSLASQLCHDLDHRGTNNAFQLKSDSPLAILYTTSTMEHHHFDQCVMILNSEGNNIFQVRNENEN